MSGGVVMQVACDDSANRIFERCRRKPPGVRISPTGDQPVGDVIAQAASMTLGVRGSEKVPRFVFYFAQEWGRIRDHLLRGCLAPPPSRAGVLQHRLHPVPEILIDDGVVQARPCFVLVTDQAAVDRVGQQLVDLATAEGQAALYTARRKDMALGT